MVQKIRSKERSASAAIASGLSLDWPGKSEAVGQIAAPQAGQFLLDRKRSLKGEQDGNLIIEADNLPALQLLATKYSAAVGVIYIDPPYNTGNTFQYADKCSHARWLTMMYPRLHFARQLLRPDGIICVSIDDNEIARLRLIMDEIFGEENFLSQITVCSNPRGRQAERHFATVHEYLLVYARNSDACKLNGLALTEAQRREFDKVDEAGRRYRLLGLRQRGAASRQEDRPALHYPLFVDPQTARVSLTRSLTYSQPSLPKKSTGAPGRWMWCRQTVEDNIERVQAKFIARRGEWDIFIRDYLSDQSGLQRTRKVNTVWDEREFNYQNGKRELKMLLGEAPVDYPKPTALVERAINLLADKEALVLDFFAGTGTTAQAVLQANQKDGGKRRFILIQQAEELRHDKFATISQICIERVKRFIATQQCKSGFDCLTWTL